MTKNNYKWNHTVWITVWFHLLACLKWQNYRDGEEISDHQGLEMEKGRGMSGCDYLSSIRGHCDGTFLYYDCVMTFAEVNTHVWVHTWVYEQWWNLKRVNELCQCQFPGCDTVLQLCRLSPTGGNWEKGIEISLYYFLQLHVNV